VLASPMHAGVLGGDFNGSDAATGARAAGCAPLQLAQTTTDQTLAPYFAAAM